MPCGMVVIPVPLPFMVEGIPHITMEEVEVVALIEVVVGVEGPLIS